MLTFLSFLSILAGAAGLLGAHFQVLSPFFGALITAGALAFLGLLFLAAVAFLLKTGRTSWPALLLGLLSLAALGAGAYFYSRNPIYDVTTDLQDPPKFLHPVYPFPVGEGAEFLEKNLQVDRSYDPALAAIQRITHPSIQGLKAKAPRQDVYAELLRVIDLQLPEWKKVLDDPKQFHAEFEVPWSPYRFVDDLVLEVREGVHEYDSRIELRSRTRPPLKSDFGMHVGRLDVLKVRLELALKPLEERKASERAAKEKDKEKEDDAAAKKALSPGGTP